MANGYGATAIINGKRVAVPNSNGYTTGKDLIQKATGGKSGRRPVMEVTNPSGGKSFQQINPDQNYSIDDLNSKKGKITSIPDRSKGYSFTGNRSQMSKAVITEQVFDIASKFAKEGVDFDEQGANWMVIPKFRLPANWHHIARTTPLLIKFPDNYPSEPPIGFYMKADIPESANGHFFAAAYHDADKEPLEHGWKWYCVYIPNGQWMPAPVKKSGDWKDGDNLWTYFKLISEVLGSND